MADTKISELNPLTGADLQGIDLLPIVDLDINNDGNLTDKETKSISITELRKNIISVNNVSGDGSLSYDTGVISYTGPSAAETRAHFSGGTGVSISSGEISIGQPVGTGDNVEFNQVTAALVGNADTATSLANSRTIALDGDVSGSASFDGSQNITITATIADDSHSHVISDIDNLQSSLDAKQGNLTVSDSSEIDFTLNGQQISASLINGSIDETKLDTSVNASLDLADSAQQPPSEGAFIDGDKTKLDGIEDNATADQTAAEIRTLVGSALDSNVFTDDDKTKLIGIEAGANVTDTDNVTNAGALMESEVVNLDQVKSFNSSDYATSTQGALADSALQSSDLNNTSLTGTTTIPTLEIGSGGISSNAFSQDLNIFGHSSGGVAPGASINITGGSNGQNQNGGDVTIAGGHTSEGSRGGNIYIRGGSNSDEPVDGLGIVYIGDVNTREVRLGNTSTDTVLEGDLDVNNKEISNATFADFPTLPSGDPTDPNHAAPKHYVDAVAEGLHIHEQVEAITTGTLASATSGTITYDNGTSGVGATLTLSGSPTANFITPSVFDNDTDIAVGKRVLVNDESNQAHNGIYTVTSSTVLTRATDFDTPTEMAGGDFLFVTSGDTFNNTGFVLGEAVTTVGTSNIHFIQFSGAGAFTAGDGLTLTGTEFSVTRNTEINNILDLEKDDGNFIVGNGSAFIVESGATARTSIGLGNVINESKAQMFTDPTFTGDVSIPDKIIHTGDTNTAIRFPANDTIDFETDGVRIVRINQSFAVTAAEGASGSSGSSGGFIQLNGGRGGNASGNDQDAGNGGTIAINAGEGGNATGDDGENGVAGDINIGTAVANNIRIGGSNTTFTISNQNGFRSAIDAAPIANPNFTGDVSLSRIDGFNDILIEPLNRGLFTSDAGFNLTLTGGSTDAFGATGNGGDVNIQGGSSNATGGGDDGDVNIGTSNTNQVNIGSISDVESEINSKAPEANPIFTGTTTLGGNVSFTSTTTEFKPTSVSGEDSVGKTLRLEAGDASGENSQAGNLILNAGDRTSGSGSGTDGNVQIGLNHTNAVQITPNTTISGTLTVTGAATFNDGLAGIISSATITNLTSTTVNSDTIRGDDFTNNNTGGSVLIRGGNTTSNDGHNGGAVNIQGGQATDSQGGDDGNINIGTSNTKAVNIGASGKTTTINGTLSTPDDPLVKNDFGIASIRKVTSGEYNSITPDENTFYVEVDGIAIFVDCEVGSGANPARNFTAILRDDDNVNTPNPNALYPAVSIPHAGTGSTDSDDSPRTALGSGTWIGNVFGSNLQNDSPLRRITVRLAPQSGSGDSTTHSTITVEKGGTLISNTDSTVSGDTVTDVVIELSGTEDVLLSYGTE